MATPVVGRKGHDVPTSSDVHLYLDPKTFDTERPILYADCEGFEGGERDPVALSAINHERVREELQIRAQTHPSSMAFQTLARSTKRILQWAKRDDPDHEKKSKRSYAVSQMYPRIFYAFSDVVVFVLTNAR